MENGRSYWVVEHYEDWHDHAFDRNFNRYDRDVFYTALEPCQAFVDAKNAVKIKKARDQFDDGLQYWENAKKDWEALVAAGLRSGPFVTPAPAYREPFLKWRVGKVTWREKQEGDVITLDFD